MYSREPPKLDCEIETISAQPCRCYAKREPPKLDCEIETSTAAAHGLADGRVNRPNSIARLKPSPRDTRGQGWPRVNRPNSIARLKPVTNMGFDSEKHVGREPPKLDCEIETRQINVCRTDARAEREPPKLDCEIETNGNGGAG